MVSPTYMAEQCGKAAIILSRICDVILGVETNGHMKREHNLHQREKYF